MSNRQLSPTPLPATPERSGLMSRGAAARLVRKAADDFLARQGDHPALHGHKLDDHAKGVLNRISALGRPSDSITAAQVIAALPPGERAIVLADCIVAEFYSRSHPQWRESAQTIVRDRDAALAALKMVGRFLKPVEPGSQVADAVAELEAAIDARHYLAEHHLKIFSRKTTPEAARALGIGWIKASFPSSDDKPTPQKHVAALATAALNLGDVTEAAASKAETMRDRLDGKPMRGGAARSRQKK